MLLWIRQPLCRLSSDGEISAGPRWGDGSFHCPSRGRMIQNGQDLIFINLLLCPSLFFLPNYLCNFSSSSAISTNFQYFFIHIHFICLRRQKKIQKNCGNFPVMADITLWNHWRIVPADQGDVCILQMCKKQIGTIGFADTCTDQYNKKTFIYRFYLRKLFLLT